MGEHTAHWGRRGRHHCRRPQWRPPGVAARLQAVDGVVTDPFIKNWLDLLCFLLRWALQQPGPSCLPAASMAQAAAGIHPGGRWRAPAVAVAESATDSQPATAARHADLVLLLLVLTRSGLPADGTIAAEVAFMFEEVGVGLLRLPKGAVCTCNPPHATLSSCGAQPLPITTPRASSAAVVPPRLLPGVPPRRQPGHGAGAGAGADQARRPATAQQPRGPDRDGGRAGGEHRPSARHSMAWLQGVADCAVAWHPATLQ
jgi:hypothetical protein